MKKIIQQVFGPKNFLRITLPVLLIIALAIIGFFSFQKSNAELTPAQAKTRVATFVNKFLMQGGNKVTIKNISTAYGLYKLNIEVNNSPINSYLTKDGKLFFPQALNINKISNKAKNQNKNTSNNSRPTTIVKNKTNKPNVELFVMSYCPYGTQIEKGILPVVKTLGDKINFQLKFVDYSMHGPKELAENLTQYCIEKDAPQKLDSYLSCFLKTGNSTSCLDSNHINKTKITSCTTKTDKEYKISTNAKNHVNYKGSFPSFPVNEKGNKEYGVQGSPTLVINGQTIESSRDSASLLKTICGAFTNQPNECKAVLSSTPPAPGLDTQASGNTNGSTANSGANCGQ